MTTRIVRTTFTLAATAVFTLMAACSDSAGDVGADKLDPIEEGATKAQVFEVIGTGPLTAQFADTLTIEKGFRHNTYLIDGTQYEVIFYRELPGNVAEPLEQAKETPIVLRSGKVLGWGWRYYVEEAMKELKLPTPLDPVLDPNAPNINKGALPMPAPSADSSAKTDSAPPTGPKA